MQPLQVGAAPPRKPVLPLVALGLGALTGVITLIALVMFLATAGKFSGNNEQITDLSMGILWVTLPLGAITFILAVIATVRVAGARKRGAAASYVPGLVAMVLGALPLLTILAGIVYYVAAGGAAR